MIADVLKDGEERMSKALDALNKNLGTIRTGRANPALLDRVTVEYYGTPTPLNQLSNISTPEARLIVIQPYDRNTIGPIEKAILQSDLGLNPNNDGQLIRLAIPPLTEERRKQMVKTVHSTVEEGKVAIRNVRRDAIQHVDKLLKDKAITEDDKKRADDDIQKLTDKFVKNVDEVVSEKEKELMAL